MITKTYLVYQYYPNIELSSFGLDFQILKAEQYRSRITNNHNSALISSQLSI